MYNEPLFLEEFLRKSSIIVMRRHMLRILSLEFSSEKKLDLSIFTFDESTNNQSFESLIQEPLTDQSF